MYSKVEGNYQVWQVKSALQVLEDAGLIYKVVLSAANGFPLGAEANDKFVKYLFLDNGLLLRLLDMDNMAGEITKDILAGTASDLVNKGSLTEMVAGLELLKYCSPTQRHYLYYWQNTDRGAQAEVDYVISKNMKIVPIEVKSGTGGSMKSLYRFFSEKHIDYGIRTSLEPFGHVTTSHLVPMAVSSPDSEPGSAGTSPAALRPATIDIYPLYALSNLFK